MVLKSFPLYRKIESKEKKITVLKFRFKESPGFLCELDSKRQKGMLETARMKDHMYRATDMDQTRGI